MKLSNLPNKAREELVKAGEEAADAIEQKTAPSSGAPHDSEYYNPELELRRLSYSRSVLEEEMEAQMLSLVLELRDKGYSWARIARNVGTTGEAARQKYAKSSKADLKERKTPAGK